MRAVAVALGALALAGCGSEDRTGDDAGAPGETAQETVEIRLSEFRLEPSTLQIEEPGTYRFRAVNDGSTAHALRLEGEDVDVQTEPLAPGARAELTVELARGTYELECPVGDHDDRGMKGSVSVGSGGTTATDDDDDRNGEDDEGDGDDGSGGYGGYGDR